MPLPEKQFEVATIPEASARTLHDPIKGVPDFRNAGVLLRIFILVNLLTMFLALYDVSQLRDLPGKFVLLGVRVNSMLMITIFFLASMAKKLLRMPPVTGRWFVVTGVMLASVVIEGGLRYTGLSTVSEMGEVARVAFLAGSITWVILHYFSLRQQAIRPSVDAAQLAALTARIRPHFLFNSLNAVLSLIRKEPQRAETALESLSELFRALMRDPRDLVLLSDEIALCRQYLDLERLRLGDRLMVEWSIDDVPDDAQVPPLMLQPLIENAVYHGIEPADEGGALKIRFIRFPGSIRIIIQNPIDPSGMKGRGHTGGNQLALENIRKRLALYYDLEAKLEVEERGGEYLVSLTIPVRSNHR